MRLELLVAAYVQPDHRFAIHGAPFGDIGSYRTLSYSSQPANIVKPWDRCQSSHAWKGSWSLVWLPISLPEGCPLDPCELHKIDMKSGSLPAMKPTFDGSR